MRAAEFRAVWSARTVEGRLDYGMAPSAVALSPGKSNGTQ